LDVLGLLVACLCHDIDHPGNTNAFEVNVGSRLALKYNDVSVLENHHASTAFSLLQDPKFNIFVNVSAKEYPGLRKRMIKGILATDMVGHFEHMKSMDIYLAQAKAYTLSRRPKPIVDEPLTVNVPLTPTASSAAAAAAAGASTLPMLVAPAAPRTPPVPRPTATGEGKYGGATSGFPSSTSSLHELKAERKISTSNNNTNSHVNSTSPSPPPISIHVTAATPKPRPPADDEELGPLLFDLENKTPAEVDRTRQFLFDLVLHSGDLQSVAIPVQVSTV
jgi:hypothetical protein